MSNEANISELLAEWTVAAREEGIAVGEKFGKFCAQLADEKAEWKLESDVQLIATLADFAARFRAAGADQRRVRSCLKEFWQYCDWGRR